MPRLSGTLTAWNDDRGFGFIVDESGHRTFAHISAFRGGRPVDGDRLSFDVEQTPDGKTRAVNVVGTRPARPKAAPRGRIHGEAFLPIVVFVVAYLVIDQFRPITLWVPLAYGALSVLAFALYGADKQAAQRGTWRTSESTLIAVGLLGGWPGAIVAQQVFRHKTAKRSFRSAFWFTTVLNVTAFVVVASGWLGEWVPELRQFI
jgi:uncharacterized membrane protein YsdA (DUF1294 family)/cold shock CspA family protein